MEDRESDTAALAPDEPIQMVLVSGFLGAGKTTALRTIGKRLTRRDYTVGMITNDQADGLVDTSVLDATDTGRVVEIPGGCFCCNFRDLLTAAHSIDQADVDIVLAEPVGSCTDLVATVINPLRSLHANEFDVAPLTVLLDPDRVRAYLADDEEHLPEEVQYIYRRQVEEADLIVLNKIDTLDDDETARLVAELDERVGQRPVLPISAEQGIGVKAWLTTLFDRLHSEDRFGTDHGETVAAKGGALTDIDYDTYAAGEAKLGWVNLTAGLEGRLDVSSFRTALMQRLQRAFRATNIEIAHLKFSISADGSLCHANLTATDAAPGYDGPDLGTVATGRLVVNVRAVGDPEAVHTIATEAITETAAAAEVNVTVEQEQAFRPDYPEPVHRIDEVT